MEEMALKEFKKWMAVFLSVFGGLAAAAVLLDFVLEVAGCRRTRAEEQGFREISIFKDGVVL